MKTKLIFVFISFLEYIRLGATTTDLPAGVLYRVKATYKYIKEDQDELSFDVGEIIRVIEYDDPDDQVDTHNYGFPISKIVGNQCDPHDIQLLKFNLLYHLPNKRHRFCTQSQLNATHVSTHYEPNRLLNIFITRNSRESRNETLSSQFIT